MPNWGKLWTIETKRPQKPNCHFWGARRKSKMLRAKAGYFVCPPNTKPPKGQGDHLRHPSGTSPLPTLILTPYKEPMGASQQVNLSLVFTLPSTAGALNRLLSEVDVRKILDFNARVHCALEEGDFRIMERQSHTTMEGEEEACGRGDMSLDDSLHGGVKTPGTGM